MGRGRDLKSNVLFVNRCMYREGPFLTILYNSILAPRFLYRGGRRENGLPVYLIREISLSFYRKAKRKNFNGTAITMPWRLNSSQRSSTPCLKNKTSDFARSIMSVIRF